MNAPVEGVFALSGTYSIPTLNQRVEDAIGVLCGLIRKEHPLCIAFSGGKDGTTCVFLALIAARRMTLAGWHPRVIVSTSDTLVENPEIRAHYQNELMKMERYGNEYGFDVRTQIVMPSLASSFQVKVLTGRGLPSFAGQNADCSVSLKQTPQISWRNGYFRALKAEGLCEPVTVLGTRYDESERRRLLMLARNDSDRVPVRNKKGDLILSLISHWDEDLVWEFLGEATTGTFGPAYTDCEELRRIYSNSAGTSCAVVADAINAGKPARGGCGARHGCWTCQAASNDKSLENLLEFDQRYHYMKGLFQLNKFIRATRWDFSRRHWIGRTIKAGYICIAPDTYHPRMVKELARYMMQLDFDEARAARRLGIAPRFRILSEQMMVAIDALWSLNGLALPFQLWLDWYEIRSGRVRYDVPDVPAVPQTPMPAARFIHVGKDWDDNDGSTSSWNGLRDPFIESFAEDCLSTLRELEDGRKVWDVPHDQSFDVDAEGTFMLLEFEMERILEMARSPRIIGGITSGYKWYQMYGVLTLSHSQIAKHDEILRRTAFKDRMGMGLDYNIDAIRSQAVEFRDLPRSARMAWAEKGAEEVTQASLPFAA